MPGGLQIFPHPDRIGLANRPTSVFSRMTKTGADSSQDWVVF